MITVYGARRDTPMPEHFHLFRDYTADLGTRADPGWAFLIGVDPGADPTTWPFPLVYSAVALFEALPAAFTFDELTEEGERQGLSASRSVEHLRTRTTDGRDRRGADRQDGAEAVFLIGAQG